MLARESNANYPSRKREMTNFTVREVKKVCKEIGPRTSGEESERKAQAYVAESMKRVADRVEVEEFEMHPKAYRGTVSLSLGVMLVSAVLLLLSRLSFAAAYSLPLTAAALVLSLLAVFGLVFEFLRYKPVTDALFPKRKSANVICTRTAAKETRRRIIFAGHIDASCQCNYNHLGGSALLNAAIGITFSSVFIQLILDIAGLFRLPQWMDTTAAVVCVITLVGMLPGFFFVNFKVTVPGANSDLTGTFASMAVLRYLAANDIRFDHTEVVAVSMAGKEAGLRGAKAFAKRHAKEDGVETVFISVDTLKDLDTLRVPEKDMNGTVQYDKQVVALLKQAAKTAEAALCDLPVGKDACDAAAVQQSGMKAASLLAKNPAPAKYYHTLEDKPEAVEARTVEAGIDILLETAFLFDAQGLQ